MSLDSWDITQHLAGAFGRFDYRRQFCCVPNLSQSLLSWEADLLVCTKAGFGIEVEVKVSASDWAADKLKEKWKPNNYGNPRWGWGLIKNFYYAAPQKLAERWQEFDILKFAGVLGVDDSSPLGHVYVNTLRVAKNIEGHRRLSDKEMLTLARVTAVRIWDLRAALQRSRKNGEKSAPVVG